MAFSEIDVFPPLEIGELHIIWNQILKYKQH